MRYDSTAGLNAEELTELISSLKSPTSIVPSPASNFIDWAGETL